MSPIIPEYGSTVDRPDVPALQKGLRVLELLAEAGPSTMAEVQRGAGLNKTMTFRLLRVLAESGYVEHDSASHRYRLGLRLLALGSAVSRGREIVAIATPHLIAIRDELGETVNLGILDGVSVVYLAMQEGQQGLRMAARAGGRDPLHTTGLGKAMVAFLPATERSAAMAGLSLSRHTSRTIVDPDTFARALDETRRSGYAIDDEENEVGARCVGVPVLDGTGRPIAGMSVSGPTGRMTDDDLPAIAERLWRSSRAISRAMGFEPVGALGRAIPGEEVRRTARLAG
jgi:IclR family acetate operon transcriptional repressor